MASTTCAPHKHHYDECVERVMDREEHPEKYKGPKEDCVEECKSYFVCVMLCSICKDKIRVTNQ